MIRFRIGHRWKREPAEAPHDSVSLELDGVNLLPGADQTTFIDIDDTVREVHGAVADRIHGVNDRLSGGGS